MIKQPDYYEPYKLYNPDEACVEICHSSSYTTEEAILFVKSLGYIIKDSDYSHVTYDSMFDDWRGFIDIVVED